MEYIEGYLVLLEYTEDCKDLLEYTEGPNGQPGSVADDEEGDQSATHTSQVEVLGSTGEGGWLVGGYCRSYILILNSTISNS